MASAMALAVFGAVVLLGGVNASVAAPSVGLLVAVAIWGAFCGVLQSEGRLKSPFTLFAIGGFVCYSLIRWLWSFPRFEAREDLISVCLAAIAFLVPSVGMGSRSARSVVVVGMLLVATTQSGYAMWQAFSKVDTVLIWDRPELYNGRGSGTFVCPNHLAGFLEMCIGMLVAQVIFLRKERRSLEGSAIVKVLMIYAGLVAVGGLIVSQSRGGWLAALGGMSILIFLARRDSRVIWRTIAVVGVLLFCAVALVWSVQSIRNYLLASFRFDAQKQEVTLGDRTMGGRTLMWKGTLPLIEDNPWFGTGMGSWRWQFQKHKAPQIMTFPEYPHNDYLNLASDYGLVGVVLMILVFAAFFRHALKVARDSKSSEERAFATGAMIAASCILIHSWFDFNLHILGNALVLAMLMGMTVAIPIGENRRGGGAVVLQRYLLPLVLVGLAGFVLYQFVPGYRAHFVLEEGLAAKAELDYSKAIERFDTVSRIDPIDARPHIRSGDVLKDQATWRIGPGKSKDRQDFANRAVAAYDRALELNPIHSDVWVSKAQAQAMAGDAAGALVSFGKAIEHAPANAFAYFAMGKYFDEQGDEDRALEAYNKANENFLGNEPMFYMNAYEVQEKLRVKSQK